MLRPLAAGIGILATRTFTCELKELRSCEVDVAPTTVLHPMILDQVLSEAISLESF